MSDLRERVEKLRDKMRRLPPEGQIPPHRLAFAIELDAILSAPDLSREELREKIKKAVPLIIEDVLNMTRSLPRDNQQLQDAMGDAESALTDSILSLIPDSRPDTGKLREAWINVKDRFPSEKENYIICRHTGRIDMWEFIDKKDWIDNGVTHWMPLPERPRDNS